MFYIGVDLGTSAVKLLLMDEKGKILNVVSKEYPLYFPNPGWSEQPPDRKSTRLNSSHKHRSRMPSSA